MITKLKWYLLSFGATFVLALLWLIWNSAYVFKTSIFHHVAERGREFLLMAFGVALFPWIVGVVLFELTDRRNPRSKAKPTPKQGAGADAGEAMAEQGCGCIILLLGLAVGAVVLFLAVLAIRWMWERAGQVLR
jgi:hypothetical protein